MQRQQELDLTGKVVLITGPSRGIGRQAAQDFARRGANLVLTARAAVPGGELPGTIVDTLAKVERIGAQAIAVQADLAEEADLPRVADAAVQRFGGVDILVNKRRGHGGRLLRGLRGPDIIRRPPVPGRARAGRTGAGGGRRAPGRRVTLAWSR